MTDIPLVPENVKPLPRLNETEGLIAWIASVDHKQIGIMYLLVSSSSSASAGVEALLMRTQLAQPNEHPSLSRGIRPDLHDARHDDDLPGGHAAADRLR